MSKYHSRAWPARSTFAGVEQWGAASAAEPGGPAGSDSGAKPVPKTPVERGLGLGGPGCNAGDLVTAGACKEPANIQSPFEGLLNKVFSRIDIADGPYAMIAVLADAVVFRCKGAAGAASNGNPAAGASIEAEYLEELPVDYINDRYDDLPRFVWHFGYGEQRRSLYKSRTEGTLFQVQLWWYPGDCAAEEGVPGLPRDPR